MGNVEHYIDSDGNECWKLNGKWHRTAGPAIIFSDGTQYWFRDGYRHREDGPAVIYTDGVIKWRLNGDEYAFDEYCKELNLTQEQILELKLKYG